MCVEHRRGARRTRGPETGGTFTECDITTEGTIDRVLEQVERDLGRITGLTNVVGLTRWKRRANAADEDWLCRVRWSRVSHFERSEPPSRSAGAPAGHAHVRRVGLRVYECAAPWLYGMAKAALLSMVRTAAIELGPLGIRVNAVSHGATRTPRLVSDPRLDWTMRENAARTPLGKLAAPCDIAAALLFLPSNVNRARRLKCGRSPAWWARSRCERVDN